ncbi:MAG TPA: D-arabinono-1,4-lactone oxidase [Acidimicrobiales bacterium]|nr:D-arabinono-1,4-lactone oxidase [Acidimicrobiales bacterium]
MTTGLRNWAGNVTFAASAVHRPSSTDELCDLVARSPRVRALGSAHSFSRVADTDAVLVRLDELAGEVSVSSGTATIPAGMRYAEVASGLHAQGWALANMASLPHIRVAGSVSTGTHGSGDTLQTLSAAVTGIELVGPDGSVRWVSRDNDPAQFPGTVVSLGALGIMTRLNLAVEPAYEITQTVHGQVPLDQVASELDAIFASAYSVSVFTDWSSGVARVWQKHRLGDPRPAWSGGELALVDLHPIIKFDPACATPQLGRPGAWHERMPHFRAEFTPSAGHEIQTEFLLDRSDGRAALAALRPMAERIGEVLHVTELRSMKADDLWLSPAYGRDTIGVHFTWFDDMDRVAPVLREVEQRLADLRPRPHWGKVSTMSPSYVVGQYPEMGRFIELAHRYDPDGKFVNEFVYYLMSAHDAAVTGP